MAPPDEFARPSLQRKGRGATANDAGRYERTRLVVLDDGWASLDAEPTPLKTLVTDEVTREILSWNDSPDVPFDRSINPYKGCEHGCIYCYARPTHAYQGLSPGLDFESRITAKPDAARILQATLTKKGYAPAPIALSGNTDAYQPTERSRGITRGILEVLARFRHPVGIVTKSALVTRDLDLLSEMARDGLAHVLVSLTTLRRDLARSMEPRAASPERRLETIAALSEAGVPVGVLASPMIPALNDHELEAILKAAADHGARSAGTIVLRLPLEVEPLFEAWLEEHHPLRARHVLSLLRELRGGQLYDPRFGSRMRGEGVFADLLAQRFAVATRRCGLDGGLPPFRTDLFKVPESALPARAQLDLFAAPRRP